MHFETGLNFVKRLSKKFIVAPKSTAIELNGHALWDLKGTRELKQKWNFEACPDGNSSLSFQLKFEAEFVSYTGMSSALGACSLPSVFDLPIELYVTKSSKFAGRTSKFDDQLTIIGYSRTTRDANTKPRESVDSVVGEAHLPWSISPTMLQTRLLLSPQEQTRSRYIGSTKELEIERSTSRIVARIESTPIISEEVEQLPTSRIRGGIERSTSRIREEQSASRIREGEQPASRIREVEQSSSSIRDRPNSTMVSCIIEYHTHICCVQDNIVDYMGARGRREISSKIDNSERFSTSKLKFSVPFISSYFSFQVCWYFYSGD